jgi:hypothetical protein
LLPHIAEHFPQTAIILVQDARKPFNTQKTSRNTILSTLGRRHIRVSVGCITPGKTTCNVTSMERLARVALSFFNTNSLKASLEEVKIS